MVTQQDGTWEPKTDVGKAIADYTTGYVDGIESTEDWSGGDGWNLTPEDREHIIGKCCYFLEQQLNSLIAATAPVEKCCDEVYAMGWRDAIEELKTHPGDVWEVTW